MKKSFVILLAAVAMMSSGCQNKEVKTENVVPSTTEIVVELNTVAPTKVTVHKEEKSSEEVKNVDEVETVEEVETTEETETAEEVAEDKDKTALESGKELVYKEQMELVYQALSQEWSIDKYFENEISTLISNHYEGSALENVGYALKDLDGDGKEELLISAVSNDDSYGMLYDVYTAPNGKAVHVLSGHERNRYYLQWLEEGAYMIANEASSSAFNSAWYYYSLIDGQLELMQGIVFNAEADENNPWFITYDEDWDVSNDTHDEDGLAQSIIDAYARSYTTLEYIPFSTYEVNK